VIGALLLGTALAADWAPPIEELEHPTYQDARGQQVRWSEVRQIASHTDAPGRVRRRQAGRTVLRAVFAGATVLETWGTVQLVRNDSYWAAPLGAQAGFTGLAAVLLWTRMPQDRREDRALLLDASNAWLRTHPLEPTEAR
jgi:hypothetical protein